MGVVNAAGFEEFQYAFESGIISDELLAAMNGAPIPAQTVLHACNEFVAGLAQKKLLFTTVGAAVAALRNAVDVYRHYKHFPASEQDFDAWRVRADKIWARIGKIL